MPALRPSSPQLSAARLARASRAAAHALLDALEPRQLMSAAPVDVTFRGQTGKAIAGQYVVNVKAAANFEILAAKAGFSDVEGLGGGGYYSFSTDLSAKQVSRWAANHGSVVAVSPDFLYTTARVPNDPFYSSQYLTNNTGQVIPSVTDTTALTRQAGTPAADMNLEQAWDISTGDPTQIAAVIDTGLDTTHQDIIPNLWFNPGEVAGDGIDNDGNGFIDDIHGYDFADNDPVVDDANGHGTAVAGVIAAAGNNGIGVTGISWQTKLMSVKVFASDELADGAGASVGQIVRGINYITLMKRRGANIVVANASLGGNRIVYDPFYTPALRSLSAAGVVFVAAAGNDSANNDTLIVAPARNAFAVGNSLVVAATDNRDELAVFSSYGPTTVDVAAPGVSIFTTASSQTLPTNFSASPPTVFDAAGNGYLSIDGTSFASPATAGVVALARAAFPSATPQEIVAAIKQGVDKIPGLSPSGAPRPLVSSGGRVNAYTTLKILGNRLAAQNSAAGGDFVGRYGSTGALVYGATSTLPFLTSAAVPAPATIGTAKLSRKSTAAAAVNPNDGTRSNSFLESAEPISYTFDFGATTQRLTLYLADLTNSKRAETITIGDPTSRSSTPRTLSSVDVSDFAAGKYVSFDLTGTVTVTVTPTRGNAIVNALFIDPAPAGVNSAGQPTVATTVEGNGSFLNNYGDQGFIIPGGDASPASFATVSSTGTVVVTKPGRDRLLPPESIASSKVRSSGLFTAPVSFDLSVNITDGSTRRVTLYTYNTEKTARAQRYTLINPANGATLDTEDVTVTRSGAYTTFTVTGNNTIRISSLGGGAPSVAGIFFSGTTGTTGTTGNAAEFVSSNSTMGGRYRGVYGTVSTTVIGDTTPEFTGNGFVTIIDPDTNKANALQKPRLAQGNIVAYLATQSTVEIPLDAPLLNPGVDTTSSPDVRRVSLYFVDFDKKKRPQRVEILDGTTGAVLSSQVVREFEKGKYLTYDVTGDVVVRLTRLSGPNAVISGIFVD